MSATYSDFKSNFKVRVDHPDARIVAAETAIVSTNPTKEIPELIKLPQTDWEESVIAECFTILQNLINGLGLDIKFNYFPEFIHVVEKNNFNEYLGKSYCGEAVDGSFCDGHVYVVREDEPWKFVHRLTHEMSHLASYYEVLVELPETGLRLFSIKQTGIAIITDNQNRIFEGFCEGVTELVAMLVRDEFICRNELLSLDDCRELKSKVSYLEHMTIIERLVRGRCAEKSDRKVMLDSIYCSYFLGDFDFIKNFNLDKETIKCLMDMDSSVASAYETAKELNLKLLA